MKRKTIVTIIMVAFFLLMMAGCVPGDGKHTELKPAGFFWGIWHGWIAPISVVFGFFRRNIRVYEVVNSGWWYDFGFYIAVISGFGGLSLFRKKYSDKHKD